MWATRARRSERAHYITAARYAKLHSLLTNAAVILSSVTASGLFASRSQSGWYYIGFGVLGIIAAIVAGIDRSQRYAEQAERHRVAGAGWSVLVNETEELALRRKTNGLKESDLDGLRKQMDDITGRSPSLPEWVFKGEDLEGTYLFGSSSS
ncbi:MAG: SLATT domain-containing protein [Frankiaceae bacterium]|nr:SLATT domain-containing protein [Frankiaceae bacterium]